MSGRPRASSFLPAPGNLANYPRHRFPAGQVVYRSHSRRLGPGYFASAPADPRGGGRFDLESPEGTCYVATDALVALRERFGPELMDIGEVPVSLVQETAVSRLRLPDAVRAADTSSQQAGNFHTLELVTTDDYELTQQWARAFRRAGFEGVRYQARFSTVSEPGAIALFGDGGPAEWEAEGLDDVAALARKGGIKVATRRPSRASFTKGTPPT